MRLVYRVLNSSAVSDTRTQPCSLDCRCFEVPGMSLRSSSVTPKSLAARRTNALKSTGPRSRRGKARVCLNALKHGRYAVLAARSARLREKLLEAGHAGQEALYGAIRSRIAQAIQAPKDPVTRQTIDRLALRIWCLAPGTHSAETKLQGPLLSAVNGLWISTECGFAPRRHTIVDRWTRAGLVFWCQKRRRHAAGRLGRRLAERLRGADSVSPKAWLAALEQETANPHSKVSCAGRGLGPAYESAMRCRRFRLAKPGAIERERYSLLANGDPDRNLEPWRSLKGDEWTKWPRPKERPWGASGEVRK